MNLTLPPTLKGDNLWGGGDPATERAPIWSKIRKPSDTPVYGDAPWFDIAARTWHIEHGQALEYRHASRGNLAFADGHASSTDYTNHRRWWLNESNYTQQGSY